MDASVLHRTQLRDLHDVLPRDGNPRAFQAARGVVPELRSRRALPYYQDRPSECANFYCGYLTIGNVGEEWKPERSRIVLAIEEDGQAAGCACRSEKSQCVAAGAVSLAVAPVGGVGDARRTRRDRAAGSAHVGDAARPRGRSGDDVRSRQNCHGAAGHAGGPPLGRLAAGAGGAIRRALWGAPCAPGGGAHKARPISSRFCVFSAGYRQENFRFVAVSTPVSATRQKLRAWPRTKTTPYQ